MAQVNPEEIKKSYLTLVQRKSNHAEKILLNEDGSVAIVRPFFQYGDRQLPIDWNYSSGKGVCRRFGFENFVGREFKRVDVTETIAVLDEKGLLKDLITSGDAVRWNTLESVGCRQG